MTGSAEDGPDWQQHIRNKERRRAHRRERFKDPRSIQDRDRARHVADRFRRAVAAHNVYRQADEGPRPRASDRARKRVFKNKPAAWSSTTSELADELKYALAVYIERRQNDKEHRYGESHHDHAGLEIACE